MKSKLIITSIAESELFLNECLSDCIKELHATYTVEVIGCGDFSKYIDSTGKFDRDKLVLDILNGEMSIVGLSKTT